MRARKLQRTGSRLAFGLSAVALATWLLTPPSFAQSVPLPKPAPKARGMTTGHAPVDLSRSAAPAPAPAPRASETTAQAQPQQQQQAPGLPDIRNLFGLGSKARTFDSKQQALANKVSTYLSSIQTLTGNFVQVGPDGSRSTGDFYIQKPGKVRFQYDPPSTIAVVSDGTTMVVRDRRLGTQDVYPLSQTPLRFLLSDRIDLMRDTDLVSVSADDMYISVLIEEKQPLIGTSRLMLMLGAKDNQLKQWTVTDPQGYDTTVAVSNLSTTKKIDPDIFKIDFTNYQTPPNN
ncbi:outer membrane lipoprotein carrier protein LolA [Afipia sp. TerB]